MRRSDPKILSEGDDELFPDDSDAGDDEEESPDDEGEDSGDEKEETREPPESLDNKDVEEFGSPRFKEFDSFLADAFQESQASAFVGAQELESYPGESLPTTPAKDDEEEANESLLSRRDKELIVEALILLTEAEDDVGADEFDMEHFAHQVKHLIQHHDSISDIEGSIFNMARQMILNNYGPETEQDFVEYLGRLDSELDFTDQFQDDIQVPVAVGASGGGGGGGA